MNSIRAIALFLVLFGIVAQAQFSKPEGSTPKLCWVGSGPEEGRTKHSTPIKGLVPYTTIQSALDACCTRTFIYAKPNKDNHLEYLTIKGCNEALIGQYRRPRIEGFHTVDDDVHLEMTNLELFYPRNATSKDIVNIRPMFYHKGNPLTPPVALPISTNNKASITFTDVLFQGLFLDKQKI